MPSNAANVLLISSTGEASWGTTGVAATRKLHGVTDFSVTINEKVEAVPAMGWYGPGPTAERTAQSAEFAVKGVWTYQEAPKILNGLFTYTSASTCASTGYIDYHWYAPVNTTQVSATYPLEFGPSTNSAWKVNGGLFNSLKLSGEAGGLWQFDLGGLGKNAFQLSTGLSTAARAEARTVTAVGMKETQLRVNPMTTGTWGSSTGLVAATLISFEFELNTKRHVKLFAGNLYPASWGDGKWEGKLKTVIEFSTGDAQTWLASMLGSSGGVTSTGAQLERIVTIWATRDSSTLVSALHFAGIIAEPIKLWGDRDGNQTLELNWTGKFTTGLMDIGTSELGNWLTFQVCNDSSKSS